MKFISNSRKILALVTLMLLTTHLTAYPTPFVSQAMQSTAQDLQSAVDPVTQQVGSLAIQINPQIGADVSAVSQQVVDTSESLKEQVEESAQVAPQGLRQSIQQKMETLPYYDGKIKQSWLPNNVGKGDSIPLPPKIEKVMKNLQVSARELKARMTFDSTLAAAYARMKGMGLGEDEAVKKAYDKAIAASKKIRTEGIIGKEIPKIGKDPRQNAFDAAYKAAITKGDSKDEATKKGYAAFNNVHRKSMELAEEAFKWVKQQEIYNRRPEREARARAQYVFRYLQEVTLGRSPLEAQSVAEIDVANTYQFE